MKKKIDHIKVKFDLIRAMVKHVPFDGWSIKALEQEAIDIGFKQKESIDARMIIYRDLFKNGSIDFIDIFSEMIDLEIKNNYENLDSKPERVPEKVKKIILMRFSLCQKYLIRQSNLALGIGIAYTLYCKFLRLYPFQ